MDSDAAAQLPDDERREILAEIEERTQLAPTKSSFAPKRRGIAFPLAVNLGAILLVAFAVFVTARVFDRRHGDLQRETTSFTSAEGAIIDQVRRESAERLSATEAEISRVRTELERIEAERRTLERTVDETLAERERVLRHELSQELEDERARLLDAGRTELQVRAALDQFRTRRLSALEAELTTVRAEAREEIQERERALDAAQAAMRRQLEAVQAHRRRILVEGAERQAGLEDELAELESQRRRESLATNRLVHGFRAIERALHSGNEAAALEEISEMRAAIVSGPDAALPVIAERRAADLFILDSLASLVRIRQAEAPTQSEPTVSVDSAALDSVGPSTAEGAEALSAGTAALARQDPDAGFTAYRRALETGQLSVTQERAIEGLEQSFFLAKDLAERSADAARAARSRTETLRRRVAELERDISAAEAEAAAARADLAAAQAELATAEEALAAARAELARRRAERSRATTDVLDEMRRRVNAALRQGDGPELPLATSRPASAENGESLSRAIAADIRLLLAQRQSLEVVEPREIRLVGTVVSVSDSAIALEPLATTDLEVGDMLWVRRRNDDREMVVARAEVSRVGEGRIEARLNETATTPLVLDLVYAEVPSS